VTLSAAGSSLLVRATFLLRSSSSEHNFCSWQQPLGHTIWDRLPHVCAVGHASVAFCLFHLVWEGTTNSKRVMGLANKHAGSTEKCIFTVPNISEYFRLFPNISEPKHCFLI
jgi:hypothetical protein